MEFSLIQSILSLSLFEATILAMVCTAIFLSVFFNRIHNLFFILILNASFVGSTIPVIENIGPLVRWLSIVLMLIVSVGKEKLRISTGFVLFWAYVVNGFIFLVFAFNLEWQLQKAILLLLLVIAIPFAFSNKNYEALKLCLTSICAAGAIYCVFNFISLPNYLDEAARFTGYSKGAPAFSLVLSSFLPFTLWGSWQARHSLIRRACGFGFIFGIITLIFSGQRTGTLGGLIGIIPLLLLFLRQKKVGALILIAIPTLMLIYILFQLADPEKVNFLAGRYTIESGLSGRAYIWEKAFSEIQKSPIIGRGIGAAENVIDNSFHNGYLEVWFNSGFLGLCLFVAALIYFICRTIILLKNSENDEIKSVFALSLGNIMGFIFINFFESSGAGASNVNLILFLFLAVLVSNDNLKKISKDQITLT